MTRIAHLAVTLALVAGECFASEAPKRIVSLDYCADQYVLQLVPRERILALSPDADRSFSYLRQKAGGIAQVRPVAEDVLVLNPDLVVRSYGGGPHAMQFFARAGIDVLQIPFAANLGDIRKNTKAIAARLGSADSGNALVARMDHRLESLQQDAEPATALYMTPTGVTSGPGTLIHEMFAAAGLENFEQRKGWYSLPLERLAYARPDIVAAAFFDTKTNHPHRWSAMRHPVAKSQMSELPVVMLQGSWTSCGAWFLVDAIEALARR